MRVRTFGFLTHHFLVFQAPFEVSIKEIRVGMLIL